MIVTPIVARPEWQVQSPVGHDPLMSGALIGEQPTISPVGYNAKPASGKLSFRSHISGNSGSGLE
jgi:hypothetical protein